MIDDGAQRNIGADVAVAPAFDENGRHDLVYQGANFGIDGRSRPRDEFEHHWLLGQFARGVYHRGFDLRQGAAGSIHCLLHSGDVLPCAPQTDLDRQFSDAAEMSVRRRAGNTRPASHRAHAAGERPVFFEYGIAGLDQSFTNRVRSRTAHAIQKPLVHNSSLGDYRGDQASMPDRVLPPWPERRVVAGTGAR